MSLPPRDSEETANTVFWGDDEGPVVMVWDCTDGYKRREGLGHVENETDSKQAR
jgi:hypothetical protein